MSFFDPHTSLPDIAGMVADAFDTQVAWYPQQMQNGQAVTDRYGKKVWPAEPVSLDAFIIDREEQIYSPVGVQLVSTARIYVPSNSGVRPGDKLIRPGGDPERWPPILSVTTIPTTGTALVDLIRTGAA